MGTWRSDSLPDDETISEPRGAQDCLFDGQTTVECDYHSERHEFKYPSETPVVLDFCFGILSQQLTYARFWCSTKPNDQSNHSSRRPQRSCHGQVGKACLQPQEGRFLCF